MARHLLYPFYSSFDTLLELREIDTVRSSTSFWSNRRKRLWSSGELRKNEVYTSKMMKRRYVVIIYEGKYQYSSSLLWTLIQKVDEKRGYTSWLHVENYVESFAVITTTMPPSLNKTLEKTAKLVKKRKKNRIKRANDKSNTSWMRQEFKNSSRKLDSYVSDMPKSRVVVCFSLD